MKLCEGRFGSMGGDSDWDVVRLLYRNRYPLLRERNAKVVVKVVEIAFNL
jgi:hypothetical protein